MTAEFLSEHDGAKLGELTATDGGVLVKLASLGDLVRYVMRRDGPPVLPVRAAAARVLDVVAAAETLPALYLTNLATYATPIDEHFLVRSDPSKVPGRTAIGYRAVSKSCDPYDRWSSMSKPAARQTARPELRGVPGFLTELREVWATNARGPDTLKAGRAARLAMREDLAAVLFGFASAAPSLVPAAQPQAAAPATAGRDSGAATAAPVVVQPEGGAWPHKADDWTDAERDALFLMRHKNKATGDDLAKIAGVSRQAIDSQIGGAKVMKKKVPNWPTAWRPSCALLKDCGFPLQPMQAVAAATA